MPFPFKSASYLFPWRDVGTGTPPPTATPTPPPPPQPPVSATDFVNSQIGGPTPPTQTQGQAETEEKWWMPLIAGQAKQFGNKWFVAQESDRGLAWMDIPDIPGFKWDIGQTSFSGLPIYTVKWSTITEPKPSKVVPPFKSDEQLLQEGPPKTPPPAGKEWAIGNVGYPEYDEKGNYLGTQERGRGWGLQDAAEPTPPPPPAETVTFYGQTFPKPVKWDKTLKKYIPDYPAINTSRDNAFSDYQMKLLQEGKNKEAQLAREKFEYEKQRDAINQKRLADKLALEKQQFGDELRRKQYEDVIKQDLEMRKIEDARAQASWKQAFADTEQQQALRKQAEKLGEQRVAAMDAIRAAQFLAGLKQQPESYQEFLSMLRGSKELPEWVASSGQALWNAPTGAHWMMQEAREQGLLPTGMKEGKPTYAPPTIRTGAGTIQNPWIMKYKEPGTPPDIKALKALTAFFTPKPNIASAYPAASQIQGFYNRATLEERQVTPGEESQIAGLRRRAEEQIYNLPESIANREIVRKRNEAEVEMERAKRGREASETEAKRAFWVQAQRRRPFWQR